MENIKPRPGLPSNAKRIFKGVIFEVWQWEQEMFDGSTQTFEKIWRFPTVEIIATVGDKILMEEQDQPNRPKPSAITFPSGRADQGDDVLEEAKRELLEETGYSSNDWSLFLEYRKSGKYMHDVYYFIARNCAKLKEPHLDAGEKIKTKLISFEELIALADNPHFWVSPEFINYLLRARLDSNKRDEFRNALFPKEKK